MRRTHSIHPVAASLLPALLAVSFAAPAAAQAGGRAQKLLDGAFVGSLGGFIFNSDVRAQLNGESSENPEIDFDETFGRGDDARRWRADLLWRITPEHHLRFMYFDNSVTRRRAVDRQVEWGDYTFDVGTVVEVDTQFKIAELAYEYAFLRRPTYEVAGSIGVHYLDMSIKLSGEATFDDGTGGSTTTGFASKSGNVPAPLPVIGLRAGWLVAPDWYVDLQGQFFRISYGDYDGHIADLRAAATWMFHPNFGLGVGYNSFRTTLDVDKSDYDGKLKLGYGGVQVFLTGAF